jgi:mannose-1-phosphate guanylyltransferase
MNIIPVILAGGIGERFWPLSRSSMPKQLLPLVGMRSMLEETLHRIQPLVDPKTLPLIITSKPIAGRIRAVLPKSIKYDFIVEPVGKNTAPAIALAAEYIEKKYGESIMLVLPADHAIAPESAYIAATRFAASIANEKNGLVVYGIKPARPDTGYGYIQIGDKAGERSGMSAYIVKRFVEKPDVQTALDYCSSGAYLWNGGMFVWKTSVILDEFASYMPELRKQAQKARDAKFSATAINRFYHDCSKQSIDYGIMEHSKRVYVVAGKFSWDDVGSWEAVGRIRGANAQGTTVSGNAIFEADCSGSIIVNNTKQTVAALGLDNVVIVATGDAILAIPRSRLGNIKEYLAKMKQDRRLPKKLF